MSLEQKIIASRPETATSTTSFTEDVMKTIEKQSAKKRGLFQALHKKPALAAAVGLVVLGTLAGTVYAVSYLWPKTSVEITGTDTKDVQTVVNVFADNCGDTANKKFGLKPGATITIEQAPKAVAAECNLLAINEWAFATYPAIREQPSLPNQPGNVITNVQTPSSVKLAQVVSAGNNSITVTSNGQETTFAVPTDAKFVVYHQYASLGDLKKGDGVALVTKDTATFTADASCTESDCHYSLSDEKSELLAAITLDESYEYYDNQLANQAYEITPCEGNPSDDCTDLGGIELLVGVAAEDSAGVPVAEHAPANYLTATIEGKLVSWNDTTVVIKTSSGREVTITTSLNIIDTYNDTRADDFGMTVKAGDTLSVNYARPEGVSSDTAIQYPQDILFRDVLSR